MASSTGGIAFISERGGGSGAIVYDSIKRRREDHVQYSTRVGAALEWGGGCTVASIAEAAVEWSGDGAAL